MKTLLNLIATFAVCASPALAHVSFETSQAVEKSTYLGVLGIGHGCAGEPTLKVRVQIPEGMIAVKPVPKAGWQVEIVTGAYETSYDYYGTPLTEGVKELIWTGTLPDSHFDQFAFRGKLTDVFAADTTVYFPVVQECANGVERWIEIPAQGQDSHDLENPAPGLKITAPAGGT